MLVKYSTYYGNPIASSSLEQYKYINPIYEYVLIIYKQA